MADIVLSRVIIEISGDDEPFLTFCTEQLSFSHSWKKIKERKKLQNIFNQKSTAVDLVLLKPVQHFSDHQKTESNLRRYRQFSKE